MAIYHRWLTKARCSRPIEFLGKVLRHILKFLMTIRLNDRIETAFRGHTLKRIQNKLVKLVGILAMCVGITTLVDCSDEFRCSVDYDCPATQVCNDSNGQCEQFICEVPSDCLEPDQICVDNQCVLSE